ncbi:hypothetical protein E0Z10_g4892 [Xylaria hypoxylon]|uniref:DUF6594 domain-containing protein n=1 Tax=Xylaria hypoxylon TaxID=37992 RepID=A0A4Z0YZA7_9PEZI|nr:hypothetical protein E0Z10_g4892 [Xylaria hypoxylon]
MSSLSDADRQSLSTSRMDRFYSASDLRKSAPEGFPSMAAVKAFWPSTGTFRTFECLDWRQLEFYETKLCYLENKLYELDVAEGRTMMGLQRSQLPFNKKIFIDCSFRDSDPSYMSGALDANENMSQDEFTDLREKLFAHIECLTKKHCELVCRLEKARTFPRVQRQAHSQLFTLAQDSHKLDKEAVDHLRAFDEMAYVSIDPVELRIQHIWLSTAPWIKKIIQRFHKRSPLPENNGSQTYDDVGLHIFKVLHRNLVILFIPQVLVPAGILYLAGLSRPLCFGVVAIFTVAFSIALIIVEKRMGHVVVGIVAYIAVLAQFLENVS